MLNLLATSIQAKVASLFQRVFPGHTNQLPAKQSAGRGGSGNEEETVQSRRSRYNGF